MAILDAGLTCSASLPCPAEMGGSIHIHGTASSIVDTVFVCRDRGTTARASLFNRYKDEEALRMLNQPVRPVHSYNPLVQIEEASNRLEETRA